MTKPKSLLILFILVLPLFAFPQETRVVDFSKADTVAMHIKYDGDISHLTKELTDPFPEKILKVRAIFRWITDNIAYDNKFYNKYYYKGKEPKTFSCSGDSLGCAIKKEVWETRYINNVLDDKKGVCQGYSMLFKKMCNLAGIEAEVIPGYVRTEDYEIGNMGNLDHAWNAFKIDFYYYLVDATWAAGGCAKDDDEKLLPFNKHFNDYYWLTPPDDFARNHFPEEPKWVLISHYTKENFKLNPYYAGDEIGKIKLITPASGMITVKKGDTIHFNLTYAGNFRDLQINTNVFRNPDIWYFEEIKHKKERKLDTAAVKKQRYVKYNRNGNNYKFDYIVNDNSLYYLEVLFDTKRAMRFKVSVRR